MKETAMAAAFDLQVAWAVLRLAALVPKFAATACIFDTRHIALERKRLKKRRRKMARRLHC